MKGKKGLGFGSYGWFNGVTKDINARLTDCGIPLLCEDILAQNYTPSEEDLNRYMELGAQLSKEIKKI